mmetsp:Transcript_69840/g.214187  ORF Transcript_69840/g.214187 Transcript_69840/m.214187 type:complete len:384 (-) Transcript_69840:506-1657(-)
MPRRRDAVARDGDEKIVKAADFEQEWEFFRAQMMYEISEVGFAVRDSICTSTRPSRPPRLVERNNDPYDEEVQLLSCNSLEKPHEREEHGARELAHFVRVAWNGSAADGVVHLTTTKNTLNWGIIAAVRDPEILNAHLGYGDGWNSVVDQGQREVLHPTPAALAPSPEVCLGLQVDVHSIRRQHDREGAAFDVLRNRVHGLQEVFAKRVPREAVVGPSGAFHGRLRLALGLPARLRHRGEVQPKQRVGHGSLEHLPRHGQIFAVVGPLPIIREVDQALDRLHDELLEAADLEAVRIRVVEAEPLVRNEDDALMHCHRFLLQPSPGQKLLKRAHFLALQQRHEGHDEHWEVLLENAMSFTRIVLLPVSDQLFGADASVVATSGK